MTKSTKLVWTSDPEEAKRLRELSPRKEERLPGAQVIRVELDRKRRKGKSVTLASGFHLSAADLSALAQELKKRCGAGGTCREHEIEIQGEHLETVCAELLKHGYKVKRIG